MVGGRSPSVVNRRFLLQRIRSCRHKCPTVDDIVDHLQSTYRDYRGLKKSPFSSIVQQTLNSQLKKSPKSTPSTSKPSKVKRQLQDSKDEDVDCSGCGSTIRKKRHKRVDVNEQRLQSMENMHLKRIQHNNLDDSSSSLSSNFGNSGEEEVSMSEDAIYGKKVEPEFDLMKSMLRTSYAESNKSKNEHSEESVELEVAINNKVANNNIYVGNEGNTSKRMLRKEGQGSLNGAETEKGDAKEEGPRLKDFGGMKDLLKQLKKEVIVPFYHSKQLQRLGVKPITGILLHGPPGCGKSSLARAIGNEIGLPFYEISATEVVSGVSGESEENIRELFYKAYRTAPSVVFIDEIDAIASKRENLQKETDRRIVTQLMTCMDGFPKPMNSATSTQKNNVDVRSGYVLVIATTNRPNAIDPALRRSGRFDLEFVLGVPDENARLEILSVLTKNMSFEGSFNLMKIARATSGFVGADLATLTNKASHLAVRRIIDRRERELSMDLVDDMHIDDLWRQPDFLGDVDKLTITMSDFEEAIKIVQPSLVREGFSGIPNVKWEDVGGLERLRIEFDRYIVRRVKYPEDYRGFGMNLEVGILLYGPPGCGKTLIAKAVANEAGANFIYIKGPELLNKYVGESELAIRTLFSRARTCAPCILFFDEVDALTTKRGQEGGWVVERLLNQLLIELDGAEQRQGVFVIGATNRLEVIDPAILRPGRFGKRLYVPLPGPNERGLILQALAREKSIDVSVDLVALGQMDACENFSGADLASLMDEATMVALEEKPISTDCNLDSVPYTIKMSHFERALAKITPSVSKKENKLYQILSNS